MDQGNEQLFKKRDRFLPGHPAHQLRACTAEILGHAREGVFFQEDIGVHETEQRVARMTGKLGAGMLLAAPSIGERVTLHQTHSRIGLTR